MSNNNNKTSKKWRGDLRVKFYHVFSILKGMNTADYKYQWGGEDWDLLDRVLNAHLEVERIKHPGLYHHYQSKQMSWN